MTQNIIFLDLDGPAFPNTVIRYHPDNLKPYPGDAEMAETMTYWRMCERFRYLWTHLYNTRNFKTVVSSAWRKHYPESRFFYDLFEQNGLPLDLHDDWKTVSFAGASYGPYSSGYGVNCTRAEEINYWLKCHPEVTDFWIFDDHESGYSLDSNGNGWSKNHDHMKKHIALVDIDSGFSTFTTSITLNHTKNWLK